MQAFIKLRGLVAFLPTKQFNGGCSLAKLAEEDRTYPSFSS